jgi:small subunit ribosomal protein S9
LKYKEAEEIDGEQLMADNRYYATGKRKTAVARVWLKPGAGNVQVNNRTVEEYFGGGFLRKKIEKPFATTETQEQYDVMATLKGGGKNAQAEALRPQSQGKKEIRPERGQGKIPVLEALIYIYTVSTPLDTENRGRHISVAFPCFFLFICRDSLHGFLRLTGHTASKRGLTP